MKADPVAKTITVDYIDYQLWRRTGQSRVVKTMELQYPKPQEGPEEGEEEVS